MQPGAAGLVRSGRLPVAALTAARAGVEERDIMRQTGHRSERMVRKYIRERQLFRNNAAGRVGL